MAGKNKKFIYRFKVRNSPLFITKIVFLVLFCINLPENVNGQEKKTVRLQGRVLNTKDKQAIPGASIVVKSTGKGTIANENGFFSIDLTSDTSTIIISCLGFHSHTEKISPSSNFSSYIIRLEEDIKQLDEVTVVTEKERIVRVSENISSVKMSPKLVAKLPNMGEVDVMRSFQLLPGVSATNETSAGLYVRGGTPDQNLILFDGMTIYHVDHFYGFFSAFNANTIDDIELMKGGFPSEYGGRISSVMKITGKPADLNNINGTATISLLSVNGAIEVPVVKDRVSLQLAARRSYTDIIRSGLYNKIFDLYSESNEQQPPGPGGGGMRPPSLEEQQPAFYFYDLNSKLTYRINNKNTFTLSLYNGKDKLDNSDVISGSFGGPAGGSAGSNNSTDIAEWGNTGISGWWKADWSPKFNTSVFLSYSNYFSNRDQHSDRTDPSGNEIKTGTIEENNVKDISFRIKNQWVINPFNSLEFGFENTYNNITYSLIFDDTLSLVDKSNLGSQSSFYLQDKLTLWNNKVEVVPGLRATYQDVTDKIYYEPRVAFSLKPFKGFKIKSAWGKYYQLCTRVIREDVLQGSKDFWLLADGETIPVSSATHFIIGASYEKGNYLFDVEAYYKDLKGLTEYSLRTTNSVRRTQTQEEYFYQGYGYAKGIDFMIQKKYGLNTGWIAYTLGEVKNTFPDLNYGKDFYALHDQTHEFKAVYCRKIKNWDLSATFVYATGKPYTAPISQYELTMLDGAKYQYIHVGEKNSLRLPDYNKLDLAINYNWSGEKADNTISLSIFNVYDHKNIWYKKYDISDDEFVETNVNYLGLTPNISFTIKFK